MFRKILLMSSVLAMFCATAWAREAEVLEMDANGEVQIAPDGHVTDYRLNSKLAPMVANLIDRNVRAWQFEPILVDGVAVTAKTSMHLHLKAEPIDGKDAFSLRVANVWFGNPNRKSSGKMRPPHYPPSAVRAHTGARVLLAVHVDETGKVVEVFPYQISLSKDAGGETEYLRKLFEQASVEAARHWEFEVASTAGGKPLDAHLIVPTVYFLCDDPGSCRHGDGVWRSFVPGPVTPAPWMQKTQFAENADFSALGDGQTLALDSRFRLKDNVIGKTL